jgi:Fe-S-cluster containining protein
VLSDIYSRYAQLLEATDKEFERVRDLFIERMQCRKGCSSCCTQLFSISAIEAAYLSRAFKALDPEYQEEMRRKARDYLAELLGTEVDESQSIEEHSKLVGPALDRQVGRKYIPCPALKDDACTVYDHRPIIARKYGIPLWNPKNPKVLQACELNFQAGEAIDGEGLVEPQMELEYQWLYFKTGVHQTLELPDMVATVASSILFDYEAVLEERIAAASG